MSLWPCIRVRFVQGVKRGSVLVFDVVDFNGVCIKVKKTGTISKACDLCVQSMLFIALRRSHALVFFCSNLCVQHISVVNKLCQ